MDISIVIVSWNVKDLLRRCLRSLYAFQGRNVGVATEVIVIDNASSDSSTSMMEREFPQVRLVANATNRGFTAANNQGMGLAKGKYILLLNPDTEIVGDAPTIMMDYLARHPDVGTVGPKLLNPDGTVQSSRRRFPTLATAFVESTILQRYLSHLPLLRHFYFDDMPGDIIQEVDWLVGACLMVRSEVIEQVGMFDEDFFMYSEEVDWCYRIKRAGWKVVYLPTAQVVHYYGQSSERDLPHRHIYFNDSKCKFFRKHHGPASEMILRWFILGTYLFQILEEGTKLALRHKPSLRRARLVLLLKVVRSGLRG